MNTIARDSGTGGPSANAIKAEYATWVMARVADDPVLRICAVLERSLRGDFVAAAVWPPEAPNLDRLSGVVKEALASDSCFSVQTDPGTEITQVAMAVRVGHTPVAVAVFEGPGVPERVLPEQLGSDELREIAADCLLRLERKTTERAISAMEVLAISAEETSLDRAALAACNELASRYGLSRVSLGVVKQGIAKGDASIRLQAMSNVAYLKPKSQLRNSIENLMEEAIDHESVLFWSRRPGAANTHPMPIAHRSAVDSLNASDICTVPMFSDRGPVGAITCEAQGEVSDEVRATLEAIGDILAPMLWGKLRARRWVSGRIVDWVEDIALRVLGPGRPSLKLLTVAIAAVLAVLLIVPFEQRLSAEAVLEGSSQISVPAPFDGFVAETDTTPGDEVTQGQVLARLDDDEFELDISRWTSERAQLLQEAQVAQAEGRRADMILIQAQLEQARSQLGLAQLQKNRTQIKAPIAGRVITGDLRQQIGAPVQRGDTLFQISPLGNNRIAIFVPDSDVHLVTSGQTGAIFLAGANTPALPFEITQIGAKAQTRDGQNAFRVEAEIGFETSDLRPGLEGVAKIVVGRQPLLFSWTRTTRAWVRRFVWRWVP